MQCAPYTHSLHVKGREGKGRERPRKGKSSNTCTDQAIAFEHIGHMLALDALGVDLQMMCISHGRGA